MIEARRRPAEGGPSSHENMRKGLGASFRSGSQSSGTPLDEDDDNPRRSTRGRNPLPPTSGPLFPPLPPKPPKGSPKPRSASSSVKPGTQSAAPSMLNLTAGSNEEGRASVSGASLTPPPDTSEGMDVDAELEGGASALDEQQETDKAPRDDSTVVRDDEVLDGTGEDAEGEERPKGKGSDDWDTYRRHRPVRGFGQVQTVKDEPEDAEEVEQTPTKSRNGKIAPHSASPSASELANRQARRRRGEEQLLLDDHLLPAEMRRTGSLKGRRGQVKGDEEPEGKVEDEEADGGEGSVVEDEPEEALGEEQVVEDDEEEDEEDDDEGGADVTRCVCQREEGPTMMIQCDSCNVWQHGPCVGIWKDEEAPDEYFCEQCKPELHGPLRKWMRSRGRNPLNFAIPSPQDLERYHYPSDRYPPSQSKRWNDPVLMDPPPMKPASRSHHRKEPHSPVVEATQEGRRGSRHRAGPPPPVLPSPVHVREKSGGATSVKKEQEVRDVRRQASKGVEHRRRVSTGGARSVSPVDGGNSQSPPLRSEPKKRSTMNSRDAMFEEEVKAALEASRREMQGQSEEAEEPRLIGDEESVAEEGGKAVNRKGKRKREDEDSESVEPVSMPLTSSGKPKHPNQYTYRPKPPSSLAAPVPAVTAAASPVRRPTPAPVIPIAPPAQHEHGTRRAEKLANGVHAPQVISSSVNSLHWHLPDHLSSFSELLSTPAPVPLEVRSARQLSSLAKNHYFNQRYGPWTEERDEEDKLILPEDPGTRGVGDLKVHLEPPARVRYPAKRITTGEMRKRVRNVLEYVGRVQAEEGRRQERAKLIGIDVSALPVIPGEGDEDEETEVGEVDGGDSAARQQKVAKLPHMLDGGGLRSKVLMDDLTRDLVGFQETFANGGFITPLPPAPEKFEEGLVVPDGGEGEGVAEEEAGDDEQEDAPREVGEGDDKDAQQQSAEVIEGAEVAEEAKMGGNDDDEEAVEAVEAIEAVETVEEPPYLNGPFEKEEDLDMGEGMDVDGVAEGEPAAGLTVQEVQKGDEVDVYREGMVDRVVTQRPEEEAVDGVSSA